MSWHQIRRLRKELAFLNDKRLETFTLQLEREDLPALYPQLTSEWFIDGLTFCCETWQHQRRRSKPSETAEKRLEMKSVKKATGTGYR